MTWEDAGTALSVSHWAINLAPTGKSLENAEILDTILGKENESGLNGIRRTRRLR